MLFGSGSSGAVIAKVRACAVVISFGVDLPEGKRKRLETMAGRHAVRNTIGASHRESMSRSGRALFCGCFGTTAAMCDCVGRALAVGLEAHRPLLSTDTVQMVNCQYRMSLL